MEKAAKQSRVYRLLAISILGQRAPNISRLIQAQLFEVDVMDLPVFATALGIIAILLWVSVLIPANRATQNDAVAALRAE